MKAAHKTGAEGQVRRQNNSNVVWLLFPPVHSNHMIFFFFGAILKELYLHLSVSQALPRGEWDSWRTRKVGISLVRPRAAAPGVTEVCACMGQSSGAPFALLPQEQLEELRQLLLNMPLSFLLGLSPWSIPALAALSDTLEQRNTHCLCVMSHTSNLCLEKRDRNEVTRTNCDSCHECVIFSFNNRE